MAILHIHPNIQPMSARRATAISRHTKQDSVSSPFCTFPLPVGALFPEGGNLYACALKIACAALFCPNRLYFGFLALGNNRFNPLLCVDGFHTLYGRLWFPL